MDFTFEFGETVEGEAFFSRHPDFLATFKQVTALVNKCFVRTLPKPFSLSQAILYRLGESCREDFLEIVFLAVNGYGQGASKMLRGLYERAVALEYMVRDPNKTTRFLDYASIQNYKALNAALKTVTRTQWDDAMGDDRSAEKIEADYEATKASFQQTDCGKCGTKRIAISWDMDVASMVRAIGEPYVDYYLAAYTIPNLQIHATPSSALREEGDMEERRRRRRKTADRVIVVAAMILVAVVRSQNTIFELKLEDDLKAVEDAIANAWKK